MKYELFGLPGSGKTTVCNKVFKKYNIKNPMNFYKNNFFGKILFHIFLNTFYFNKENKYIFQQLMGCLENKEYKNSIDEKVPIELYIKYITFIHYLEKKNKQYIIDEGVVHYCIALYSEYNVDLMITDKILNVINVKNKKIGLDCDIQKAIDQINLRNRKECPLDFLNDQQLRKILNKYNEALQYYGMKYFLKTSEEIEDLIVKKV